MEKECTHHQHHHPPPAMMTKMTMTMMRGGEGEGRGEKKEIAMLPPQVLAPRTLTTLIIDIHYLHQHHTHLPPFGDDDDDHGDDDDDLCKGRTKRGVELEGHSNASSTSIGCWHLEYLGKLYSSSTPNYTLLPPPGMTMMIMEMTMMIRVKKGQRGG